MSPLASKDQDKPHVASAPSSVKSSIRKGYTNVKSKFSSKQKADTSVASSGSDHGAKTTGQTSTSGHESSPSPPHTVNNTGNRPPPGPEKHDDTQARPVASQSPRWDQAVAEFERNSAELKLPETKAEYDALAIPGRSIAFEQSILSSSLPDIFAGKVDKRNHAFVRRLQGWLPGMKTLGMTLSRLDPHHLAPYIVAGSFFVVEVSQTLSSSATFSVVRLTENIRLHWLDLAEHNT
jgi:hypothetical protein